MSPAEVWCSECDQPSVSIVRGAAYCGAHRPRVVELTMSLLQAAEIVARLELARADGRLEPWQAELLAALEGALPTPASEAAPMA